MGFDKAATAPSVAAVFLAVVLPLACADDDESTAKHDGGSEADMGATDMETDLAADMGLRCGDRVCDPGETSTSCPDDCTPSCDESGDCEVCGNCATDTGGACVDESNACASSPPCGQLLGCLEDCLDQTCADDCFSTYPDGADEADAFLECVVCDECPSACLGFQFVNC